MENFYKASKKVKATTALLCLGLIAFLAPNTIHHHDAFANLLSHRKTSLNEAKNTNELTFKTYLAYMATNSCEPGEITSLMLLGDSNTRGGGASNSGYRPFLDALLRKHHLKFDFVGRLQDGNSQLFDTDHEGYPGYTSEQLIPVTREALLANDPHIILLMVGTNDIDNNHKPTINHINQILDIIDTYNPHILVLVGQVINRNPYSLKTSEFNDNLASLINNRIKNGDQIILVDMESALKYPQDLFDEKHATQEGYNKIAIRWFVNLVGHEEITFCNVP